MNNNKNKLRQEMSHKRNALTKDEVMKYSNLITDALIGHKWFQDSKAICIYMAFRNEVSCHQLAKKSFQLGKKVFVPVTNQEKETMDFFQVFQDTQWKEGAYGIMEPVLNSENICLNEPALIIMPGLLFDQTRNRIGYGGGYYDKYLQEHNVHKKIAFCYDFQVLEHLPNEKHDIKPDLIVTDKRII